MASKIIVRQLWVRLPHPFNYKLNEFYATLGSNIPKYLGYEGTGIQYIFCVDKNLEVENICKKFGINEYSVSTFETDSDKFNCDHQIHPTYSRDPKEQDYKLSKHISE